MRIIQQFDFFPLTFDDKGKPQSRQELNALIARASAATDAIFIAHGFRHDVSDATRLYTSFLKTFRAHLSRPEFQSVAARRFVVGGVYWPSKPFRETFGNGADGARGRRNPAGAMAAAKAQLEDLKADAAPAKRRKLDKAIKLLPTLERSEKSQNDFVALVFSVLDRSAPDKTEGLPQIRKKKGSEVLARLSTPRSATDRGIGDVFGTVAGGVGQFLNLALWYVMKDRSGSVGAKGVADAVRALRAACPQLRIHFVGHSLGGRLIAACAKALGEAPKLQPDSVMLLAAAFSHFGFSPDNGRGNAGFFRDVITKRVVKGPFVSTFSAQDTVVGKAYALMSRLAGDDVREIGDAADQFGGIGRNGPQKTKEVASFPLHQPGTAYKFKAGVINSLDGSGGLIKDHGDVTNDAVTYAFASAIART